MKPRHAAALALVGWYLMLPPVVRVNGQWTPLKQAPLAQWFNDGAFDDAASCKQRWLREPQEMRDFFYNLEHHPEHYPNITYNHGDELREQAKYDGSTCIATDDPRLKGN
jgi:hypothetical protein